MRVTLMGGTPPRPRDACQHGESGIPAPVLVVLQLLNITLSRCNFPLMVNGMMRSAVCRAAYGGSGRRSGLPTSLSPGLSQIWNLLLFSLQCAVPALYPPAEPCKCGHPHCECAPTFTVSSRRPHGIDVCMCSMRIKGVAN